MNQPIFSNSELFCLEDAMLNYKITHSKYCDEDCMLEIDNILLKLKEWRLNDHKRFVAIHNLIYKD